MYEKSETQFFVALIGALALALALVGSMLTDVVAGRTSQTTSLLAGGLIGLTGTAGGWLFGKNGNGNGNGPPPLELPPPPAAGPRVYKPDGPEELLPR
jgi:hypothetical protein